VSAVWIAHLIPPFVWVHILRDRRLIYALAEALINPSSGGGERVIAGFLL
jgi:hypothetical protein